MNGISIKTSINKTMKQLIKGQSIRIDDHRRGIAHANFDDDLADIHLDKRAKSGSYTIRVPLNTNHPVNVEVQGDRNHEEAVPEPICREIREVFENVNTRREFVDWLVGELRNYPYREPARQNDRNRDINRGFAALRRISRHFGLNWSNRTVRGFLKEYKTYGLRCMATITDGPDMYFLSVDTSQFMIADFMMIGLNDRSSWEEVPFVEIAE